MTGENVELIFLIDVSKPMIDKQKSIVDCFNRTVNVERFKNSNTLVSVVAFSKKKTLICDRKSISSIGQLYINNSNDNENTFLDVLGDEIIKFETIHKYLPTRFIKTVFVVASDNLNDCSYKYTTSELREIVNKKKEEGWEFNFIGRASLKLENVSVENKKETNVSRLKDIITGFLFEDDLIEGEMGNEE